MWWHEQVEELRAQVHKDPGCAFLNLPLLFILQ